MAVEILVPQVGDTIDDGQVTEWHAHDGDHVTEGQPLFVLAGTAEPVGAPSTGKLRIIGRTGVDYAVGSLLGFIE